MASPQAINSQRKLLTRDPSAAWTRLFNNNVDSLIGVSPNDVAYPGIKRQEAVTLKLGNKMSPHYVHSHRNSNKSSTARPCKTKGDKATCYENRGKDTSTRELALPERYYSDESTISSSIQEPIRSKREKCGHKEYTNLATVDLDIGAMDRVQSLSHFEKVQTNVIEMSSVDPVETQKQGYNDNSHNEFSKTVKLNLLEHKLSSKHIHWVSARESNNFKILIGPRDDVNSDCWRNLYSSIRTNDMKVVRRKIIRIYAIIDSQRLGVIVSDATYKKPKNTGRSFFVYILHKKDPYHNSATIGNKASKLDLSETKPAVNDDISHVSYSGGVVFPRLLDEKCISSSEANEITICIGKQSNAYCSGAQVIPRIVDKQHAAYSCSSEISTMSVKELTANSDGNEITRCIEKQHSSFPNANRFINEQCTTNFDASKFQRNIEDYRKSHESQSKRLGKEHIQSIVDNSDGVKTNEKKLLIEPIPLPVVLPKTLTRDPNNIWKRLFEDNVSSLVQTGSKITNTRPGAFLAKDKSSKYAQSRNHVQKTPGYNCLSTHQSKNSRGYDKGTTNNFQLRKFFPNPKVEKERSPHIISEKSTIADNILVASQNVFLCRENLFPHEINSMSSNEVRIKTTKDFQNCISFNLSEHWLFREYFVTFFTAHQQNILVSKKIKKRSKFTYNNAVSPLRENSSIDFHNIQSWTLRKDCRKAKRTRDRLACVHHCSNESDTSLKDGGTKSCSQIASKCLLTQYDPGASGDVVLNLHARYVQSSGNICVKKLPTCIGDIKAGGDYSENVQNFGNTYREGAQCFFENREHVISDEKLGFQFDDEKETPTCDDHEGSWIICQSDTKYKLGNTFTPLPHSDLLEDSLSDKAQSCTKFKITCKVSGDLIRQSTRLVCGNKKSVWRRRQIKSKSRDKISNKSDLLSVLSEGKIIEMRNEEKERSSNKPFAHTKQPPGGPANSEDDISVPSSSFKLSSEQLQEFETVENTNTIHCVKNLSSIPLPSVNIESGKTPLVTAGVGAKSNIDLLKLVFHELTDKVNTLGTRLLQHQHTLRGQRRPGTQKTIKNLSSDSYNARKEGLNKEGISPRDGKWEQEASMINPFNTTICDDIKDVLQTQNGVSGNNNILERYFKQQGPAKDDKMFLHKKIASILKRKGVGTSDSKEVAHCYGYDSASVREFDLGKNVFLKDSSAMNTDAMEQEPFSWNIQFGTKSNGRSFDDLNELGHNIEVEDDINELKLAPGPLTDRVNTLGTKLLQHQQAIFNPQVSETDQPGMSTVQDSYLDDCTSIQEDINKQEIKPREGKQKRDVPLINPFNTVTFEDPVEFLPTHTFNTKVTRNDNTLSNYFKQQETVTDGKMQLRGRTGLVSKAKGAEVCKSKDTMSKPHYNDINEGLLEADFGIGEISEKRSVAIDLTQEKDLATESIKLNCKSEFDSLDDLSESSLQCLLEQLIQRGKIEKAFVMDTNGMLLARSSHSTIPVHTIKCFYDSLRGHYNGLVKIDGRDGNVYLGFKSVDGDMFVGTSARSVTVCKRGANAIVVGFASKDASGSCIKEMSELSDVLDKRGL